MTATLDQALETAMTLMGADRGNIQLVAPDSTLVIATSAGFEDEFLQYFSAVDDDAAACGRAAKQHAQVVVPDVTLDPDFAPHYDIMASSAVRAVQSTPLIDASGQLVGMISTHYADPHAFDPRDLEVMRQLGVLIGHGVGKFSGEVDKLLDATANVGGLVSHLEDRLQEAGYFGASGSLSASHPLSRRMDDLEDRLALDVSGHALSRRMRRSIAVSAALTCLIALGGFAINDLEINQNETMLRQIAATQAQSAKTRDQIAQLVQHIAQEQAQGHATQQEMTQILKTTSKDDQAIMALEGVTGKFKVVPVSTPTKP